MSLDTAYKTTVRHCNNCGIIHAQGDVCRMGLMYDLKQSVKLCPHCKHKYRGDTTEPVEVYIPWENRKVWESCWACFIRKLEG